MERLELLNQRLIDHFSSDETGRANFRIVWSDDQVEKRLVDSLDSGVRLLTPEVREMKKYPYLLHCYVLERLVVVPVDQQGELPVSRLSYEPIWAYRDHNNNPLPPIWNATKLIIDTLHAAMGDHSALKKYIDSEKNTTPEGRHQRIAELQEELFGNETHTGDALRYREGIVVPNSFKGVM